MARTVVSPRIVRVGIAVFAAAALAGLSACQTGGAVRIDDDDIGVSQRLFRVGTQAILNRGKPLEVLQ